MFASICYVLKKAKKKRKENNRAQTNEKKKSLEIIQIKSQEMKRTEHAMWHQI